MFNVPLVGDILHTVTYASTLPDSTITPFLNHGEITLNIHHIEQIPHDALLISQHN